MPLLGRDALKLFGNTLYSAVFGHFAYKRGLCDFDPNFFDHWERDATGLSWKFRLKENLYFHDGRRTEIEDVEFSLTRFFLNQENLVEKTLLSGIRGLSDHSYARGWQPGMVPGIRIVGPRMLNVCFDFPRPRFMTAFEHSTISLTPREHICDDGITWRGLPVGAGPFRIVDVAADSTRVTVERNETAERMTQQTIEFLTGPNVRDVDFVLEGDR